MAATKLNPYAPEFPCPYAFHFGPPPPPPPHYAAACPAPPSPHGAIYICAPFPVPSPHHHHGHPVFGFPVLCPQKVSRKGVSVAPHAHGCPPHKLMCSAGTEKLRAAAMAQVGPAAVAVKGMQEPPAAAVTAQMAAPPCRPRLARQKAERRGGRKAYRPRRAAGPRARARSPSPEFTTRTPLRRPPAPELGRRTTVMLRNIPNKLKGEDMTRLLDGHCARANTAAGDIVSAYDVLYLPMDFRKLGNFGYAFINFTTAAAARRLRDALHGCGWKVHGSKKVIEISPAKIQGKEALVRHLGRQKLPCGGDDEFLPAMFSPPRDGVHASNLPVRLGAAAPRPPPRPAKTAYVRRDSIIHGQTAACA
ncbi:hypothetical protein ACP70R_029621 [Stipagrostis hirtigluma subsp. patula]